MIKIAIVGTGGMAGGHAEWFQNKISGCKVVACCDVAPDRVKTFAERFNIPAYYTDMDDMLRKEQLDAVSNVTPDRFHAPLSLKAIAKGLHVLCEKPLATCHADARKMAVAAQRKGVVNMVNFSYRNSSAIHRAARLIRDGKIGRVIHTSRWATGHANSLRLEIHGDQGALQVNLDESWEQIKLCLGKDVDPSRWKTVNVPKTPNIYQRFIKSIRTGVNDQPDFTRGAAIQKILDACALSDARHEIVQI